MSDVKAVRYLLANNAALTAVVSDENIIAGRIPQGTVMPAIGITHISGVWRGEISSQSRNCMARVQVTVMAPNYTQQKEIIRLVRAAIPRRPGTVNGVVVESILRLPDGPDFGDDDLGIHMQTQDFMVEFIE